MGQNIIVPFILWMWRKNRNRQFFKTISGKSRSLQAREYVSMLISSVHIMKGIIFEIVPYKHGDIGGSTYRPMLKKLSSRDGSFLLQKLWTCIKNKTCGIMSNIIILKYKSMVKKNKITNKITPTVPEMTIDETKMPVEQMPMTEQEMHDDLERGLEDVKNKNAAIESQQYAIANQMRQLKLDILRELFDFLQKNGVDPNDLASINQFLQKLEQQDPDFVTLFELVLNGLSPEGQTAPAGTGENATVSEIAGTMTGGNAPPLTPVASTATVSPITPSAPTTPPNTPPAFMERFNNLKNRGII